MNEFDMIWQVKQLSTAFDRAELPVLQALELSPSEGLLLICMADLGKDYCYATQLHTALGLSRPAVSSTVKRLRLKGFVAYREDENDDRRRQIVLLPKTRDAIPALRQAMREWANACTQDISPADLETARCVLKAMRSRM